MKRVLLVSLLLIVFVGCEKTYDPNTGQAIYRLDPNAAKNIDTAEKIGEMVVTIAPFVSVYWPPAALITGILAGVIGAWKKLKPQITKAQTEQKVYYDTTSALVYGIDKFKTDNPQAWEALKKRLEKAMDKNVNVENVIRALRGLPPKEP